MSERERILGNKELMDEIRMYEDFKNNTVGEEMKLSDYLIELKESIEKLAEDHNKYHKMYQKDIYAAKSASGIEKAVATDAISSPENVENLLRIVRSEYYKELIESAKILEG